MKKIVLAVCLMFGGAAFVNAQERDQSTTQDETTTQDQTSQDQSSNRTQTEDQPATQGQTQYSQEQGQEQEGEQISISELPEPVTAKLEGQDYSGWTVGNAYKKSDASNNNEEMYVVELRRGTETKKVKFDSDGNKMDKKDKKHKDDKY